MDKIDWNEAPAWADRLLESPVSGKRCWANEVRYRYSCGGVGFLGSPPSNFKVVSNRITDKWQEGEKRMNNIGQNGNDGHYDEAARSAMREYAEQYIERRKPDAVNHPEHYQSESGIECIDAIRASLGLDGFVAYCRGNAIKYSWRSGKKSEHAEDLRKAAWYLERAASELEKVSE